MEHRGGTVLLWIFVLIGKWIFALDEWCVLLLLSNPDPDCCFAQKDQYVVCFNFLTQGITASKLTLKSVIPGLHFDERLSQINIFCSIQGVRWRTFHCRLSLNRHRRLLQSAWPIHDQARKPVNVASTHDNQGCIWSMLSLRILIYSFHSSFSCIFLKTVQSVNHW